MMVFEVYFIYIGVFCRFYEGLVYWGKLIGVLWG